MAFGRVQFCCNCFGKLSEGCRISGATDSPCKGMDTFVTHGTKVHLLNKAACMTETKSYIGRTGENVSLGVVLFMPLWLYCSIHLQSRYAIFLSVSGQGPHCLTSALLLHVLFCQIVLAFLSPVLVSFSFSPWSTGSRPSSL